MAVWAAIGYYRADMQVFWPTSRVVLTASTALVVLGLAVFSYPALAAPKQPAAEVLAAKAPPAQPETGLSDIALKAGLLPHTASYDIRLISARNGSQVVNVTGKMTYSWEPSCEGWVTDHTFKLRYDYAENDPLRISSKFSTLETLDGRHLRFYAMRDSNGEEVEQIRGTAILPDPGGNKPGKVTFEEPADLKYTLSPDTLFPMMHTLKVLESAQAGKKFISIPMFDGSDSGGPIQISAVIGKPREFDNTQTKLPKAAIKPVVKDAKFIRAWPLQLAFFPLEDKNGVEPDYELRATLLDNGVISDMIIDYGDFKVAQRLNKLTVLPTPICTAPPSPEIKAPDATKADVKAPDAKSNTKSDTKPDPKAK